MTTNLKALSDWVNEVADLTKPKSIHWCTGSDSEIDALTKEMVDGGDLLPLDENDYPNCYLHRSDPSDVARVEHLTFVCTTDPDDAGPTTTGWPG